MDVLQLVAVAMGGGGVTIVGQMAAGWWKSRGEKYRVDRTVDAELESERGKLMLDLLKAARDDATAVRQETASIHAVHLEEALDHLHALLNADCDIERKAAEKRAKAFLRRMRPEIGDIRNQRQKARSAHELAKRDGLVPGEQE